MDNVVNLNNYRAFKQAKKLFSGYGIKLRNMHKEDIANEIIRLRIEYSRYSDHPMTLAKVKIFEEVTGEKISEQSVKY